jgi:hypothetical protein
MGETRRNKPMFPLEPDTNTNTNTETDRYDRYDRYDTQSQLKSRHVFPQFSDATWNTFKAIATKHGVSIRSITKDLILAYIKANAPQTFQTVNITNIKVEGDVNLFQVIFEEEVSQLCKSIRESVDRNAPKPYLRDLRENLWTTLKKNPHLSPELAEEVKAAFTLLREAWK